SLRSTGPSTTETYTLSLHDALPILLDISWSNPLKTADRPPGVRMCARSSRTERAISQNWIGAVGLYEPTGKMIDKAQSSPRPKIDRKSTRLNSSHGSISYAVFCLK